jgi:DNA helicase-2/ATP-dependent DNA helicase PcrA
MSSKDNHLDDHVDEELFQYLSETPLKSFFLFAGAGSGKTGSLVKLLQRLRESNGRDLWLHGQKIAIITYTNAACEEIQQRLGFSDLFVVQTIHSFMWELIRPYNNDIREWLNENLQREIDDLKELEVRGRKGTNASQTRLKKIKRNIERIEVLNDIKKFIYDPNKSNEQKNALSHSNVIEIGSEFLCNKSLMQEILVLKYPILLIDESQDTKKELIDALFQVQDQHKNQFALGLFGDTMQRIYFDGKENLSELIPSDWERPIKKMNHRSQKRIVDLINHIRKDVDGQVQNSRSDKAGGVVRFFVFPNDVDKGQAEKNAAEQMLVITGDKGWGEADYECLILEHHMAALRLEFTDFFLPLYNVSQYKTAVLDGTLSEIRLFSEKVAPLVESKVQNDEFKIAEIIKRYSPILNPKENDETAFVITIDNLKKANRAVKEFLELLDMEEDPSCIKIVRSLRKTGLFDIPYVIQLAEEWSDDNAEENAETREEIDKIKAWHQSLQVPFSQVQRYVNYITGKTTFNTHQGVKGLEFPRVMAIIDDEASRGTWFRYEKLFGVREGSDTSIVNANRLFYVICSRAEESLALIAYTGDPEALKRYLIDRNWFAENEVIVDGCLQIS